MFMPFWTHVFIFLSPLRLQGRDLWHVFQTCFFVSLKAGELGVSINSAPKRPESSVLLISLNYRMHLRVTDYPEHHQCSCTGRYLLSCSFF